MLRCTALATPRFARAAVLAAVPHHAAPAIATLLGPQPRRWLMVQEPGTRERPKYDKAFESAKKSPAKDKYKPTMEKDMLEEEEIKHAQRMQRDGKQAESESEKGSAAFQSDSKEEQHTTAAADMGGAGAGAGTGAGGSETDGSKKQRKKKAEGTSAGGKGAGVGSEKKRGKSPIGGHPGEAGYVRRDMEKGMEYGPGA